MSEIIEADITGAVIIEVKKNWIDNKLGSFTNNSYSNDNISFSDTELTNHIDDTGAIDSVGDLSTVYSSFLSYVNSVFANSKEELFDDETWVANYNSTFDTDTLLDLMKSVNTTSTLALNNCNSQLQEAIDLEMNGRDTNTELSDGFFPNDIIFIEDGISVTVNVSYSTVGRDNIYNDITPIEDSTGSSQTYTANLAIKVIS